MSRPDADRFTPCLSGNLPGQIIIKVQETVPAYNGPYAVVPTVDGKRIATAGMRLDRDIEIQPIPYESTENEAGGDTVYIGNVQIQGSGGSGTGTGTASAYPGPYTVTPAVVQKQLETAGKRMERNVVIQPIPFEQEENETGGNTVYIGKEG